MSLMNMQWGVMALCTFFAASSRHGDSAMGRGALALALILVTVLTAFFGRSLRSLD